MCEVRRDNSPLPLPPLVYTISEITRPFGNLYTPAVAVAVAGLSNFPGYFLQCAPCATSATISVEVGCMKVHQVGM